MESKVTVFYGQKGYALVTVLLIAAVGLLFGAGALLLFRNQCQLRIARQHELEKVYAVRSVLNYIRTCSTGIDTYGDQIFRYNTGSGRDLTLHVKPVEDVFPRSNYSRHLDMASSASGRNFDFAECVNQYDGKLDYEYGAIGATNFTEILRNKIVETSQSRRGQITSTTNYGLVIDDSVTTNRPTWWVNVGMRETDGWVASDFGLRYWFNLHKLVGQSSGATSGATTDVVRLCLIRSVTNRLHKANGKFGYVYGWPLSNTSFRKEGQQEIEMGERAIVFQLKPDPDNIAFAGMTISEYVCMSGITNQIEILKEYKWPWQNVYVGIQLADNHVSAFYIEKSQFAGQTIHGYHISATTNLTSETYNYFKQSITLVDKAGSRVDYGGVYTNAIDGKVHAPELRAVFEFSAAANRPSAAGENDFISEFKVTPAYQYDVFMIRPELVYRNASGHLCYDLVTNRATVAQRIGDVKDYLAYGYNAKYHAYSLITYDTHGTEMRGFRAEERERDRRARGE